MAIDVDSSHENSNKDEKERAEEIIKERTRSGGTPVLGSGGDAGPRTNGLKRGTNKWHMRMELFSEAKAQWPVEHNQFSCQHGKDMVLLFRACCSHLGPHAVGTGSFRGSPCYEKDRTRMMWFDTSFLVSMRKSAWGTKPGREVVLAIWVRRKFVEDCLGKAVCSNTFGGRASPASSAAAAAAGTRARRPRPGASSERSLRARVVPGDGFPSASGESSRSPTSSLLSPSLSSSPPTSPPQGALYPPAMMDLTSSLATAKIAETVRESTRVNRGFPDAGHGVGKPERKRFDTSAKMGRTATVADPSKADMKREPTITSSVDDADPASMGTTSRVIEFGSPAHRRGSSVDSDGLAITRSKSLSTLTNYDDGSNIASGASRRMKDGVRLHWEPERLPSGEKHRTRRVVQLGLKGKWLEALGSGREIVKVERLDVSIAKQRAILESSKPHQLMVPVARPLDCGYLQNTQLEALHLVSNRARPKLRILCLHGYLQNSQIFRKRTRQLSRKLRQTAELVYVDAPHLLAPEELPPPITSPLHSPLARAAEVAAAAAAVAAAKVITTGEGGAPRTGIRGIDEGDASGNEDDSWTSDVPKSDGEEERAALSAMGSGGGAGVMGHGVANRRGDRKPLSCNENDGTLSDAPAATVCNERVGARAWWRCDAEERREAKAMPGLSGRCEWKGLDTSLASLCKVWEEQGPFDGLLGFSQGAAMASIFFHCVFGSGSDSRSDLQPAVGLQIDGAGDPGCANDRAMEAGYRMMVPSQPPPSFAIFVSGCYSPHPSQIPSYPLRQDELQEDLASLHVWAVEDPFVPAAQSQRLAGMYLHSSVFMHRGSHSVPQGKDLVPHFIRFLEEFR